MENDLRSRIPIGDSNALEILNFRLLREIPEGSYLRRDFKNWIEDDKNTHISWKSSLDQHEKYINNSPIRTENTQLIFFQKATRILMIAGQCVGLNPVTAISNRNISKIRFRLWSWKFLYTTVIAMLQTFSAGICLYKLLISPVSLKSLLYWIMSCSSWCTIITFIHIAIKWEVLVKEICNCNLDQYINSRIITRCNIFCLVFLILGFVDHILYILLKISEIMDCTVLEYSFYEKLIKNLYKLFFDLGIPYNIPVAVLLQFNNIIIDAYWNLSDIYIICISLYLTSILNEINKKIVWAADKNDLSAFIWSALREDYSRATRLIRRFDDVFSALILISFASKLFAICLMIYNVLENGINPKNKNLEICSYFGHGLFKGYEYPIYITFTLIFTIVRFTTMCLVAAGVNDASSVPASGLYRVPSCSYSMEVQRFLEQVHDEVVALTGLEYFHITKELLLTMAGTILTYELVLLQFRSDELNNF